MNKVTMVVQVKESTAPKAIKKKRVSKKLKSAWRKHVDITDVDDFLEEKRLEERLGDFSELPNNELFIVDASPSKKLVTTKQAKREKLRAAPLKCLSLLRPFTKVPDPIAKRNRVRTREQRMHYLITKKESIQIAQGIFKKRDLQKVHDVQRARQNRLNKETKFDFDKNIWDAKLKLVKSTNDADEVDKSVAEDAWIQGDVERHILRGPGKRAKELPRCIHKRPHCLNAVEIPHPGMSYNPTYQDHQQLLQLVAEKEKKIIKEEKHLDRVTTNMFKKVTAEERDANWLVEMMQGLQPDQTNEKTKSADDDEYTTINPPVKNKEKSKKQRRKQREQQKLQEKLRQARIEKKKVSDMYHLKVINEEISKESKKAKVRHEKRVKKKEHQKFEAKRIGANKFEELDLEFNMAKDIAGNLRNVKKEGNLLRDRFKSLQKRNIIEPTVHKSHKKGRVKRFVRVGFKEDTWKSGLAKKLTHF